MTEQEVKIIFQLHTAEAAIPWVYLSHKRNGLQSSDARIIIGQVNLAMAPRQRWLKLDETGRVRTGTSRVRASPLGAQREERVPWRPWSRGQRRIWRRRERRYTLAALVATAEGLQAVSVAAQRERCLWG